MDEIIKSLYLRLDANTSTLTRSAIGQILVKIIYFLDGLVSKEEIFKAYAQINGIGKADEQQLEEILEELVDKDIKKRSGIIIHRKQGSRSYIELGLYNCWRKHVE